jgi:surface protein
MANLFDSSDFNQDISGWNTSAVTTMNGMFSQAASFNQPIGAWDVSSVTDFNSMFNNADAFNQDLSGWTPVSATNMAFMFLNTDSFNQDLSSWDVQQVTTMESMFEGATSFNSPVNFVTNNALISVKNMFKSATSFNQPIPNWNNQIQDMSGFLYGATSFNSAVTALDTGTVTDMSYMFYGATSFNQDLSLLWTDWVTNMEGMFYGATSFNSSVSGWVTSSVTNMAYMFMYAGIFDQDLSSWDVSSVTTMNGMFSDASSFNQPIGSWNTASLSDAGGMFGGTTVFDKSLAGWNVSSITSFNSFGTALSRKNYDATLVSWSQQVSGTPYLQMSNSVMYTPEGKVGRDILISNGWTINDGGFDPYAYDGFEPVYPAYMDSPYAQDGMCVVPNRDIALDNVTLVDTSPNPQYARIYVQEYNLTGDILAVGNVTDRVAVFETPVNMKAGRQYLIYGWNGPDYIYDSGYRAVPAVLDSTFNKYEVNYTCQLDAGSLYEGNPLGAYTFTIEGITTHEEPYPITYYEVTNSYNDYTTTQGTNGWSYQCYQGATDTYYNMTYGAGFGGLGWTCDHIPTDQTSFPIVARGDDFPGGVAGMLMSHPGTNDNRWDYVITYTAPVSANYKFVYNLSGGDSFESYNGVELFGKKNFSETIFDYNMTTNNDVLSGTYEVYLTAGESFSIQGYNRANNAGDAMLNNNITVYSDVAPSIPPLSVGLLHYYPLDGSAADIVGAVDGTDIDSVFNASGVNNFSRFYGSGITQIDITRTTNGTVAGWVYYDTSGQNPEDFVAGMHWGYSQGACGGTDDIKILMNSSEAYLSVDCGWYYSPKIALSANTWHHLIMYYNSTYIGWYVDGVEQTGIEISIPLSPYLFLGGRHEWSGNYYDQVRVDEVAVYDRVLLSTEATQLSDGQVYNGAEWINATPSIIETVNLTNGLVKAFNFENSMADGLDGYSPSSIVGNSIIYTSGTNGSAAVFDGSTCAVYDTNAAFNFGSGDWSFSYWIKQVYTPIAKRQFGIGYDQQDHLNVAYTGSWGQDYQSGVHYSSWDYISSPHAPDNDNWVNFIVVKTGGYLHFYRNGVEWYNESTSDTLNNPYKFEIGCRQNTQDNLVEFYPGSLDALYFYNRALNGAERVALQTTYVPDSYNPPLVENSTISDPAPTVTPGANTTVELNLTMSSSQAVQLNVSNGAYSFMVDCGTGSVLDCPISLPYYAPPGLYDIAVIGETQTQQLTSVFDYAEGQYTGRIGDTVEFSGSVY